MNSNCTDNKQFPCPPVLCRQLLCLAVVFNLAKYKTKDQISFLIFAVHLLQHNDKWLFSTCGLQWWNVLLEWSWEVIWHLSVDPVGYQWSLWSLGRLSQYWKNIGLWVYCLCVSERACVYAYIRTCVRACMCSCVHMYVCACVRVHACVCTCVCLCVWMQACMHVSCLYAGWIFG